jgi:signal transduction histidine kinase
MLNNETRSRLTTATWVAVVVVPAALTFTLDLISPGELDVSALYAVSIIACGRLRLKRLVWIMTGILMAITLAGLFLGAAPVHPEEWHLHLANRCFSALGLLVLASIVHFWMQTAQESEESRAQLAHQLKVQREFIADAAHELRTPLAVLRTRIDTIASDEAARPLGRDVDAMGRTVAQLLDIAEMEGLHIDAEDQADLRELCAATVAHLAPLALAKGRNIELHGSEAGVWVHGNAEALSRAVRNLVENALQHTPAGTTVIVDCSDGGLVRVSDRGPGVPETDRALIFRRFWRRDRSRTGNAGLGLSIVSRVVEAHRGSVTVGDRPDGGAVFSIDLSPALVPPALHSSEQPLYARRRA